MERVMLRKATLDDARALHGALREEDLRECRAAGVSGYGALRGAFDPIGAEVYAAIYLPTGEVMALFGSAPVSIAGDEAVVWLLGSRRVDDCKFEYLRLGRKYLKHLLSRYSKVYNYVEARSMKSIRFLRMLGFRFLPDKNVNNWLYFEKEAA